MDKHKYRLKVEEHEEEKVSEKVGDLLRVFNKAYSYILIACALLAILYFVTKYAEMRAYNAGEASMYATLIPYARSPYDADEEEEEEEGKEKE